jgi:hypothetical protein
MLDEAGLTRNVVSRLAQAYVVETPPETRSIVTRKPSKS